MKKRDKLLELERQALKKCSRLKILDDILLQPLKVLNKNNPNTYLYNLTNQSIIDFVLEKRWMKDLAATCTMDNLVAT